MSVLNLKTILTLSLTTFVVNAFAFEASVEDSEITRIEAQPMIFKQAHLCPHPIELKVRVYNDLQITKENLPDNGWYQFFVLPAGETNWADAVKSNKVPYEIQCRS